MSGSNEFLVQRMSEQNVAFLTNAPLEKRVSTKCPEAAGQPVFLPVGDTRTVDAVGQYFCTTHVGNRIRLPLSHRM
jgi:hypothetical protein